MNDKILKWCGFEKKYANAYIGMMWKTPEGNWCKPVLDFNFLEKHVMPKLGHYEVTFDDESCCIYIGDEPDIKCYEGINPDLNAAWQEALIKLIGGE